MKEACQQKKYPQNWNGYRTQDQGANPNEKANCKTQAIQLCERLVAISNRLK